MTHSLTIPAVVAQHVEELTSLWMVRDGLVNAGHAALRHLARLDDRLAAHQDACVIAGPDALRVLSEQLGSSPGSVFACAVTAFELSDRAAIARCLAVAEAVPDTRREMISSVGWVSSTRLKGIVKDMLEGTPTVRQIALAACRVHCVNPGASLSNALRASEPELRAEALRDVGSLGQAEFVSVLSALHDDDPDCQFWAAWSAALLGDRHRSLEVLTREATSGGVNSERALRLVCQSMASQSAHDTLRRMATGGAGARLIIVGSGIVGDPVYIPWLIKQMSDDKVARAAGEAFSLITGVDLALLDLERVSVKELESGPTDNPDDVVVDEDPDEGLPWPEPILVNAWWTKHQHEFRPGTRYFVGLPLSRDHCVFVLKEGTQRQRRLAAQHLCLLAPGTPLFNTSAPAWRQQRRLTQL